MFASVPAHWRSVAEYSRQREGARPSPLYIGRGLLLDGMVDGRQTGNLSRSESCPIPCASVDISWRRDPAVSCCIDVDGTDTMVMRYRFAFATL